MTRSFQKMSLNLTLVQAVRDVEGVVFPLIFTIGATACILVIIGVIRTKLHTSTRMLIVYQAANSIIGLGANGIYYALVIHNGGYVESPESLLHNLPGAFAIFAIYSGMLVLLLIAVQRNLFLFLPVWARNELNGRKTALALFFGAFCVGTAYFVLTMFPCCMLEYNLALGKWFYSAEKAAQEAKASLVVTTTVPLLTFLLYVIAGVKLVLMKRKKAHKITTAVEVHSIFQEMHQLELINNVASFTGGYAPNSILALQHQKKEQAREARILLQFGIISAAWIAYSISFNVVQQIPEVSKLNSYFSKVLTELISAKDSRNIVSWRILSRWCLFSGSLCLPYWTKSNHIYFSLIIDWIDWIQDIRRNLKSYLTRVNLSSIST